MLRIEFRYKDKLSKGEWRYQECIVESFGECRRIYGLDSDPDVLEYEFLDSEEI